MSIWHIYLKQLHTEEFRRHERMWPDHTACTETSMRSTKGLAFSTGSNDDSYRFNRFFVRK
jgi:hypothetical protein